MKRMFTHNGKFHADDVMAAAIIRMVYGTTTPVVRVNKVPENLGTEDIVFDIGGGELDHHQRGGNGFRSNGVPYAAAGLVWRKYGNMLCANMKHGKYIWGIVDNSLMQGIDAVDNGAYKRPKGATPMNISQIIGGFNPSWQNKVPGAEDAAFETAVSFAYKILQNTMTKAVGQAEAKKYVDEAVRRVNGPVLMLDKFVPWQEAILSSTNPKASKLLYVVFPSDRGGYNIQSIPDRPDGCGQRKPLPAAWRGLSGDLLRKATKNSDAVFCHPAGFIAGAKTRTGAKALAKQAID